jgi:hypothetical protein
MNTDKKFDVNTDKKIVTFVGGSKGAKMQSTPIDVEPSYLEKLMQFNFFDVFQGILGVTHYVVPGTDKVETIHKLVNMPRDTWVHIRHLKENACEYFWLLEKHLKFVPRHCMNCWKVVVKPQTLEQLFKLEKWMWTLNKPSKCGVEDRDYVPQLYGAYFYNRGREAGDDCFEAVRGILAKDELLRPLVDEGHIILKRFCSEFEIRVGNSSEYVRPDYADKWEDICEYHFGKQENLGIPATEDTIKYCHLRWIQFAYDRRDMTALKYNNGHHLYTQPFAYRRGWEDDKKGTGRQG